MKSAGATETERNGGSSRMVPGADPDRVRSPGARRANRFIDEFRLKPYALLAPYGCGRIVAHDLYDIVEPR